MMRKLSIIVPVYNEESTIEQILVKLLAVDLMGTIEKEIVVVNDCSTDQTKAVVEAFLSQNPSTGIRYFDQEINKGKGAAVHRGIELATGEYLIVQDADLELDPREINYLIKPVIEGYADAVFGSRFTGGRPRRVMFYMHTRINRMLTWLSNRFSNLSLTDMATCYKLVKTETVRNIRLKEKRFGFDPELTAKLSRVPNIRIYEVGISYHARAFDEGKKIGWKDGLRHIWCIVKYNTFSKR